MADNEEKVSTLFQGDDGGEARARWADKIGPYLQARSAIEPVRHHVMPAPPWPDRDSPMLGYLVDRAKEIFEKEGERAAIVWLAAHAWFEGALEERYRIVQELLGQGPD